MSLKKSKNPLKRTHKRRHLKYPHNIIIRAELTEKKGDYKAAGNLYNLAANRYRLELDRQDDFHGTFKEEKVLLYIKSIFNSTLNSFKSSFEDSGNFNVYRFTDQIKDVQKERQKLLAFHNIDYKKYNHIERSFFCRLEEWLTGNGLKNESAEIYYRLQIFETEIIRKNIKSDFKNIKPFSLFYNIGKLITRNIFFVYLGYGVKVLNLVLSAICIIVIFGILYTYFQCIDITCYTFEPSYLKGIYASAMTFTGFDFDEIAPTSDTGRFLLSLQGIFGFITFGGIVAYIWRRLR